MLRRPYSSASCWSSTTCVSDEKTIQVTYGHSLVYLVQNNCIINALQTVQGHDVINCCTTLTTASTLSQMISYICWPLCVEHYLRYIFWTLSQMISYIFWAISQIHLLNIISDDFIHLLNIISDTPFEHYLRWFHTSFEHYLRYIFWTLFQIHLLNIISDDFIHLLNIISDTFFEHYLRWFCTLWTFC